MYINTRGMKVVPTCRVMVFGLALSVVWSNAALATTSFDVTSFASVQLTANPGGLDVAILTTSLNASADYFGDANSSADASAAPTVDDSVGDPPVGLSVGESLTLFAEAHATAQAVVLSQPLSWGTGSAIASGVLMIGNDTGGEQSLSFDFSLDWSTQLEQQTLTEWATVEVLLDVVIADLDSAGDSLYFPLVMSSPSFDTRLGLNGATDGVHFSSGTLMIPKGVSALVADLKIQAAEARSSVSETPLPAPLALIVPALAYLAQRGRRAGAVADKAGSH